jgi:hypothetical protein
LRRQWRFCSWCAPRRSVPFSAAVLSNPLAQTIDIFAIERDSLTLRAKLARARRVAALALLELKQLERSLAMIEDSLAEEAHMDACFIKARARRRRGVKALAA